MGMMYPMYPVSNIYDNDLAKAYVVYQTYGTCFFNAMEALDKGTIFPELYRPYDPNEY